MIELHAFDDSRAQAGALAKAVGDALGASLAASGGAARTTLAVSGGTSPRPFLQTLALAPLDWSRIDVTLVDDRRVPETDSASNARLLRETLLAGTARAACFQPLVDVSASIEANVAALNADAARALPSVAVLGMGEDGHTASLFADAPEWAHIIAPDAPRFVAVHPVAAPHARVSLSLAALTRIERLYLLISGSKKLDVLKAAASAAQENAISKLANDKGVRLDVYWCAN
ncbi:6-phosphogluconolactonase [Trinickia caryophylli]|uniref:6-phosphogluconolactonase n=1 Tax=Trinickia caryophylli TaxID=28094 RepID=A0A1X7CK66_TRICW|nr:6-phosphogluconolactonase [Trinickia caryophylli]PMS09106.1 6-phosphogluconolactonase [Trinickia caryophylli]WQE13602.1 6-phosphogluconolactonase [Trinickia caryophylli]GLU30382.1 6-phosphogluconolactonase [Trinickia caryophylli]SME97951.1 6-phosphogluconolactonase [Trinickia caryophylli]